MSMGISVRRHFCFFGEEIMSVCNLRLRRSQLSKALSGFEVFFASKNIVRLL